MCVCGGCVSQEVHESVPKSVRFLAGRGNKKSFFQAVAFLLCLTINNCSIIQKPGLDSRSGSSVATNTPGNETNS